MKSPLLLPLIVLLLLVRTWPPAGAACVVPMLACNASMPSFQYQVRVVSVSGGPEPVGPSAWWLAFGSPPVCSGTTTYNLGNWSQVANFSTVHMEAVATRYPNSAASRWMPALVVPITLVGPNKPNKSAGVTWGVEVKLIPCGGAEPPVTLAGNLYTGGRNSWASLAMLISTNRTEMPAFAMTAAQFNKERYWKVFESVSVPTPPQQFPIADRFISGDTDATNLAAGITAMSRLGFTALLDETDPGAHKVFAQDFGLRTGGGVYTPPEGDADRGVSASTMSAWAGEQMAPFTSNGFTGQEIAMYNIADEPAFYFPADQPNMSNPIVNTEWQEYLKAQGLTPGLLGSNSWAEVMPSADRQATSLTAKRLFYWTFRFASAASTSLFARATAAIQKNISYAIPTFANFNCYQGRVFTPGAVANNPNKTDENAAMVSNDWFEFGRAQGAKLMWTEDWFADHQAATWSYYTSKMRSAARLAPSGEVQYGGYIVPVSAGERPDGILTKILSLIGGGGKALEYFIFGEL